MAHGLYQLVIVKSVFGRLVAYMTVQALKGTEYTIYAVCVCVCVCAPRLLITSGMI